MNINVEKHFKYQIGKAFILRECFLKPSNYNTLFSFSQSVILKSKVLGSFPLSSSRESLKLFYGGILK